MNEGVLESALQRAETYAHYKGADLAEQAVHLMAGVVLAHAFIDGNKRTALAAGAIFLILNGFYVIAERGEFGRQIEALILRSGSLEEATEQFIAWLRPRCAPVDACGTS